MTRIRIEAADVTFEHSNLSLSERELNAKIDAFVLDLLSGRNPNVLAAVSPLPSEKGENLNYTVYFNSIKDSHKISAIKEMRSFLGIGLKDAKDMSETPYRTIYTGSKSMCEAFYRRLSPFAYLYVYDPNDN